MLLWWVCTPLACLSLIRVCDSKSTPALMERTCVVAAFFLFSATTVDTERMWWSSRSCDTDADCSLNGVCSHISSSCVCDFPWHGSACGLLSTLAVDASTHPYAAAYGFAPNVSSWGGSIVQGDDNEGFHLFVAQMRTGGLIGWEVGLLFLIYVYRNTSLDFLLCGQEMDRSPRTMINLCIW